jgi:uncharacterized protein YjiS (DUF1127 family)
MQRFQHQETNLSIHTKERGGIFATLIGIAKRHMDRSRTASELERLSDRELRDIGLSRSEIHSVSVHSFASNVR